MVACHRKTGPSRVGYRMRVQQAFIEKEGNYQDFYPSPALQSPARAPGAALAATEGQKPQSRQGQGFIREKMAYVEGEDITKHNV